MVQIWYTNTYQADHLPNTDVARIASNYETLKTNHSGTSAPANPVAGMNWFDTTNKILRTRNQANSAWLGTLMGKTTSKIAIYDNSAGDGWVDASAGLEDKILSIKGGSTYVTGGATAGTWTISGLAGDAESTDGYVGHNHQYHKWVPSGYFYDSGGVLRISTYWGDAKGSGWEIREDSTDAYAWTSDAWVKRESHTHTIAQDGTWRMAASVVTVQYLNA